MLRLLAKIALTCLGLLLTALLLVLTLNWRVLSQPVRWNIEGSSFSSQPWLSLAPAETKAQKTAPPAEVSASDLDLRVPARGVSVVLPAATVGRLAHIPEARSRLAERLSDTLEELESRLNRELAGPFPPAGEWLLELELPWIERTADLFLGKAERVSVPLSASWKPSGKDDPGFRVELIPVGLDGGPRTSDGRELLQRVRLRVTSPEQAELRGIVELTAREPTSSSRPPALDRLVKAAVQGQSYELALSVAGARGPLLEGFVDVWLVEDRNGDRLADLEITRATDFRTRLDEMELEIRELKRVGTAPKQGPGATLNRRVEKKIREQVRAGVLQAETRLALWGDQLLDQAADSLLAELEQQAGEELMSLSRVFEYLQPGVAHGDLELEFVETHAGALLAQYSPEGPSGGLRPFPPVHLTAGEIAVLVSGEELNRRLESVRRPGIRSLRLAPGRPALLIDAARVPFRATVRKGRLRLSAAAGTSSELPDRLLGPLLLDSAMTALAGILEDAAWSGDGRELSGLRPGRVKVVARGADRVPDFLLIFEVCQALRRPPRPSGCPPSPPRSGC